jgi:hypothetical protein
MFNFAVARSPAPVRFPAPAGRCEGGPGGPCLWRGPTTHLSARVAVARRGGWAGGAAVVLRGASGGLSCSGRELVRLGVGGGGGGGNTRRAAAAHALAGSGDAASFDDKLAARRATRAKEPPTPAGGEVGRASGGAAQRERGGGGATTRGVKRHKVDKRRGRGAGGDKRNLPAIALNRLVSQQEDTEAGAYTRSLLSST